MSPVRWRRRRSTLLTILVASALALAISAWVRTSGILEAVHGLDPAAVRELLAGTGALAPLLYTVLVTVEVVVAPLPGVLLYGPGGVLFGGFWGGALALVGNLLGAGVAFALARRLGRRRAREWLRDSRLGATERRLTDNGLLVVFLLRVNPLTSSDLVSYAAGLTSMAPGSLLLGTALGLAPVCWAQAYAAESLVERFPWLLLPAVAAAVLYLLAAVWLLVRTVGKTRDRD